MKKPIKIILGLLVLAVIIFMPHMHHAAHVVMCGVPIIGAQDLRIAYTNAYRTLWNKATKNGAIPADKAEWLPNVGNKVLSQSDLISEINLSANKSNYNFGINVNQLQNGQPIYQTERRLNLQDTFFCSQIGYFLRVVQTYTGNTDFQYKLFTHPPGQLVGTGGLTDWSNYCDTLWNGSLNLSINNRTIVPEWDLWRHYETPQTQFPTYVTAGTNYGFTIPINDEVYGAQSGMFPCEPMWVLDGSYDNVMQCNFNNSLAALFSGTGTGQFTLHMVIVMRGILAQNCGKIMEPGLMNPS